MNETRRVLFLSPHKTDDYSGPAVLAQRLIGGLEAERIDVLRPQLQLTLTRLGQVRWILYGMYWILRLRPRLDVVHVQGAYLFHLVPALAAIWTRLPVVVLPLVEGGDLALARRSQLLGRVQSWIVRRSHHAFALSSGIESELVACGLESSRVTRVPNLVDDRFFDVRAAPPEDEVRLAFVGKVGRRKRASTCLDILSMLQVRTDVRWSFDFIGPFDDAEFADEFIDRVEQLGLSESVTVTGYVDDVPERLAACNVFVLPSSSEGLPGALCEALAVGLPAVVSDVGGMQELIAASGAGVCLQSFDPVLHAEAIKTCVTDRKEWRRLSDLGRAYAEEYLRTQIVTEKYVAAIERSL